MTLQHYTRRIEQDLLPLTQRLVADIALAVTSASVGRDPEHVAKAALLALAIASEGIRRSHDIDIAAWAEANRLAQTPSLSTTAELLPATLDRIARNGSRASV